ncbi:spore coat assembly protein SafA [Cytobacillus eiseniae]|uniref:Spore coat assembly protein SafA n=1 Tax=Cytobacillus eiseniae TaxID=762947 RepID=A0ABS4RCB4_9BACI|nr:CAP domain-containing protein [Cytobacillus eiseniae]MBP2239999.1 spore coat assembly protein SafA [Cytobacillus eiseniae]
MRRKIASLFFLIFFFAFGMNISAQTKYIVNDGDTLWEISIHYDIDLEMLINSNPQIINPDIIYPGQIVIIPGKVDLRENNNVLNKEESELIELINKERLKAGLLSLKVDSIISRAASLKSIDMMEKEYISHHSPTYGSPGEMLKYLHISYQNVNENIGAGYRSANEMFISWMNSHENRKRILNKGAKKIGVAVSEGGPYHYYWTILIVE